MTKAQLKSNEEYFETVRKRLTEQQLITAVDGALVWESIYGNGAHEPFEDAFIDGFAWAIDYLNKNGK